MNTAELCKLTGADARHVNGWADTGVLIRGGWGWTTDDVTIVRRVMSLGAAGWPVAIRANKRGAHPVSRLVADALRAKPDAPAVRVEVAGITILARGLRS